MSCIDTSRLLDWLHVSDCTVLHVQTPSLHKHPHCTVTRSTLNLLNRSVDQNKLTSTYTYTVLYVRILSLTYIYIIRSQSSQIFFIKSWISLFSGQACTDQTCSTSNKDVRPWFWCAWSSKHAPTGHVNHLCYVRAYARSTICTYRYNVMTLCRCVIRN